MDLRGAKIRNIFELSDKEMNNTRRVPLSVNVPCYQRPYRWDKEKIANLFSDYDKNKESDSNCDYFIGSIVLVENKDSRVLDIIDGQQRVTTIFLLNYLRFLFLRSYISELIVNRRMNLDGPLNDLEKSYESLLGKNHLSDIKNLKKYILGEMNKITKDRKNEENVYKNILNKFRSTLKIPDVDMTVPETYYAEERCNLCNFIQDDCLCFGYSLESFNRYLKDALSRVCIKVSNDREPEFNIIYDGSDDSRLLQYTTALDCIYKNVKRHVKSKDGENRLDYVNRIIEYITDVLENIKFAVILTGSEEDAYVLFEVLNDRAMEIDDLELVKNLLFKRYFTDSRKDYEEEDKVYSNIETLDKIWSDEVFNGDISYYEKRLISYFSTVFLTGDTTLKDDNQRYRKSIEDLHLSKVELYSYDRIRGDFSIYQMMRTIIERFNIKKNNKDKRCLQAVNSNSKSITYKTFHLLNALGYYGVICGLCNYIVGMYLGNFEEKDNNDIDSFKKYLDDIISDRHEEQYSEVDEKIHKLSFELWQMSLLCEDYEKPREQAQSIIEHFNRNRFDSEFSQPSLGASFEDFEGWMKKWRYKSNKKNSNLKIKILFLELFKCCLNRDTKTLNYGEMIYAFGNSNKIQLDHLEPSKPDTNCPEKFFNPLDGSDREDYIDSIGNMMLLDESTNNNKSNAPLYMGLDKYEDMYNNFWLNQVNGDLLEKWSEKKECSGTFVKIPTKDFFDKRRDLLIRVFYNVVNRNGYESERIDIGSEIMDACPIEHT